MGECPKEPKIPIYHIVGGCFLVLKLLSLLWHHLRSRRDERLVELYVTDGYTTYVITSRSSKFSHCMLSLFLFIWFILGNIWVFRIWQPNYEQLLHEPSNWCDKTLYFFTAIQIFTCYGIAGLILFIVGMSALCDKCSELCAVCVE